MMTRARPYRFHLVYIRESVSGSISAPRDVDLCVCVCVWRLCLAPSSPHSPSGKLRAGTVLLFIPLSHTALAITIYRHAATGKVRVDLPACISPWWHEWNALFCLNSVCCLIPDEAPANSCCVSNENRRPADKTQTGHKLRTMVFHITHSLQLLFPRTLCLKHPGWFSLEAGCYFYKQLKI